MRWLLGVLLVVVLFLHNLPYLIRDQAVIWLRSQGVEQVTIKTLKVDWLQGEVVLAGVSARSAQQLPLQLEWLRVALDYSALTQKRLRIRVLELSGLTSGVAQQGEQLWLGPLNLSRLSEASPSEEKSDATPSQWLFGIDQLRLTRIDWQARLPKQTHHLVISQAALDALYLWDMQQVTDLTLEGTLNGAPLKVSTAMTPLPERKRSELRLQVKQFPLHSVTALFEPQLRAAVDLDLVIEAEVEGALSRIKQSGSLGLSNLSWQGEGMGVRQQALNWRGDLALELNNGQPVNLSLGGELAAIGSELQQGSKRLTLNSLAAGVQAQSADMKVFSVSLPDTRLSDLKLHAGEQRLLELAALGLSGAEIGLPLTAQVAGVSADGLAVAGETGDWITLEQLRLDTVAYDGDARLTLKQIRLKGSDTRVALSSKGELRDLNWLQQQLIADASNGATEAPPAESAPPSRAFSVGLGGVQLTGKNRVQFRDEGVKPAFAAELDIERLNLGAFDTARVTATPFDLAARINRFASLTAQGRLELTGDNHNGDWTLNLKDLELPPLSPYAERFTGYYLNSGQFNLQSEGRIAAGNIDGSNKLRLNRLTVDQRDAGRVEAFSEKLTMPLETAIMVLEDNDNNITLEVPVSGALSDPQFGYQAIINDLATRGLKSAALGFLTKSLQPYATLISLAKSAVEASEKGAFITLTPVQFEPGSVALDGASRGYLDKLAEMLNERQAMRLNICGRAVPADRLLLEPGLADANRKRKEPLPPEALEQELQQHLEQLAGQRSDQVKAHLIQRVDASRVFLCFAKVDAQADALPRVELGL